MAKILSFLGAFIVSLVLVVSAHAATLTNISGNVLVDRGAGNGFESVLEGATINPGDVLQVPAGGSADLAQPDGSFSNLTAGTHTAPAAPVPASTTPTTPTTPPPANTSLPTGGFNIPAIVPIGGIFAAGAFFVLTADDDDDDPTTP